MKILDGAMGTMIQRYGLTEEDFGKGREGCNDVLVLTRPDIISEIHREYLAAGADIIETNSFNANAISLEEYGLRDSVREINLAAARIARDAAREYEGRMVAGSMGPSNVALSLPEVAGARGVDFDVMRRAYAEQAEALISGGVDVLLLETIFDTLNAKAAIAGIEDAFDMTGRRLPLMISVTLTEQGRTLSGQTLEAFLAAVSHARPFSVGMNCGFGAEQMGEWLRTLQAARKEGIMISLHPNAGLPDELGNYTQTPGMMAEIMGDYMQRGLIDIAGGCCGTTPEHIRLLALDAEKRGFSIHDSDSGIKDSGIKEATGQKDLNKEKDSGIERIGLYSGLETVGTSGMHTGFLKVGERCNVAGSRKFLRLINEGNLSEALDIAAAQIEKGAAVLDINMDDAMLDAPVEMERFVKLLGQDGRTSRVPLMIDSSDMEVIRRALKHIQGRPIVNSISLKEGEGKFLDHAREIRRLGAAVVVMAFDEEGQATTFERRIEICSRAYQLLTEKAGYRGEEIIFDPNILTIATGIAEHDRYALDFLEAVEWIKKNLPGAKVSGGVSNLSFAFRGNNRLREAMHSIFLEHAIARGMDMAIVDPKIEIDYSHSKIPADLREAIEDVIFMRREDATDRLMEIASVMKAEDDARKAARKAAQGDPAKTPAIQIPAKSSDSIESKIEQGNSEGLEPLLDKALEEEGSALGVVNNRLMKAMKTVGDEFGAGRMFLPQVVRAAGVMKRAIDYLTPHIEAESAQLSESEKPGTANIKPFVIATVKGDVHDIGKNIVGVILKCGGFEVIDLGVMVEEERILAALRESGAKYLGLSGLITPSLKEMQKIAEMLEREGLTDVTLCVGGATTSDLHTAVKIAPLFSGVTLHTRDAAVLPVIANRLADPQQAAEESASIRKDQEHLRREYEMKKGVAEAAVSHAHGEQAAGVRHSEGCPCCSTQKKVVAPMPAPAEIGIRTIRIPIDDAVKHINWKPFLHTWRLKPILAAELDKSAEEIAEEDRRDLAEARRLIGDALRLIEILADKGDAMLTARAGVVTAHRQGDAICIGEGANCIVLPTPRKVGLPHLALADFIAESKDWIGLFAVTAKELIDKGERLIASGEMPEEFSGEYGNILLHSLADRLVEAATEEVHNIVHKELWGLTTTAGIRPAVGYAALPDHKVVFELDRLLDYGAIGIRLTENGALAPSSTTTGLIIASPEARYF
ncbi:MAG: homocysteine S-methyltransferase family protein [Muribaculaceae bacterium]|nr:homocysteine S-methyltransferase family protein [Muribaculaceae bacterium]